MNAVDPSDLKGRADIVYAIAEWFEHEQKVPPIPIVLHDTVLATNDTIGSVFGMCTHTACFFPTCAFTDLHVHISLLSSFEFFEGSDRGIKRTKVLESDWKGMCEMDLIRSCLEEFFHYWQNLVYGSKYVSREVHTAVTREKYRNNNIELEAKSFAYSETERFLDAAYPDSEDRVFFRDVLFQIRDLESPTE